MTTRRVLVVGSGGREHALAWRLSRDPEGSRITVAPGNDGIALDHLCIPVGERDGNGLVDACRAEGISLAVIGPELALAEGVAEALEAAGIRAFGPSRAAARLESSKWFAKEVMREAGVPTARAEVFESLPAARQALDRFRPPWVLKADGLAAGKGVRVTPSREEAEAFVAACLLEDRFGPSGRRVVIEEFLEGEEASVMAVCDGRDAVLLPAARDFKRAHDGGLGPNTGGMGAYAPIESLGAAFEPFVLERIVRPILRALRERGTPFRGALYCGLMIGPGGVRVVEFNVRFGDPETQVVLPLVDGSFAELLESAAAGSVDPSSVARAPGAAVSVAIVDEGYPESSRGGTLQGLEQVARGGEVAVFHAAVRRRETTWTFEGGRIAHVMARGADRERARRLVYDAIGRLGGAGWRTRHDIAALEVASDGPDSRAGKAPLAGSIGGRI